jgi:HEAT repeat protein
VSGLRKERVKELLRGRDLAGLVSWAGESRDPLGMLFAMTYDKEELTRWRAIEAIGAAAAQLAASDMDKVREFIRRLLWQMNDESGGVAWHAPEVLGELLFGIPALIDEYGKLLPQYLRQSPFEAGAHFGLARIAAHEPERIRECREELRQSLQDENPAVRAWARIALGEEPVPDDGEFRLYDFDDGELKLTTVAEAVETYSTRR